MTVCYWCGAKDTIADVGKELDDGKYKMVQCSKCKNAYYVVNKEKMSKPKPMTNEEWFCGLSTEEKAKFLREMVYYGCLYDEWEQQSITENVPTEVIIVKWLKQPHT